MLRSFNPFTRCFRGHIQDKNRWMGLSLRFSSTNPLITRQINPGDLFRHYNGNIYIVREVATHTETYEKMVIYYNASNPFHVWCRSMDMFNEFVEIPYNHTDKIIGRAIVPRFDSIPKEQYYIHQIYPLENHGFIEEYWIV